MKVIFLDIDGVLNSQSYYEWRYKQIQKGAKYEDFRDEYGDHFSRRSSDCLNTLITKTGAKIVISSTWRTSGLEVMKEMWKARKMEGEIIGITPHLEHRFRGLEIKAWLRDKGFYHLNWDKEQQREIMESSGIDNYIIIDDDSDMTYTQRNHFIHIPPAPRHTEGFTGGYLIKATNTLNKDIIQLNY